VKCAAADHASGSSASILSLELDVVTCSNSLAMEWPYSWRMARELSEQDGVESSGLMEPDCEILCRASMDIFQVAYLLAHEGHLGIVY
jgi:hypothetical protein